MIGKRLDVTRGRCVSVQQVRNSEFSLENEVLISILLAGFCGHTVGNVLTFVAAVAAHCCGHCRIHILCVWIHCGRCRCSRVACTVHRGCTCFRSQRSAGLTYRAGTHQQPQRGARGRFGGCTVWTVSLEYQWCVCVSSKTAYGPYWHVYLPISGGFY